MSQTEKEFMDAVTQYAEHRGWGWAHVRTAQHAEHYVTPVSGPLGKGHADLLLARRIIVYAELKRDAAAKRATPTEQLHFLSAMRDAGAEAYLWEPGDWPEIERVLA
jgi:hypothetical protein